jgi:diguanylate cyclase (GGDEF)-like protein
MSWFGRGEANEEVALLRDALVDCLAFVARDVEGQDRVRVDRLVDRLKRPPAPTGLRRELAAVLEELASEEEPAPDDTAALTGDLARTLVEALAASALLDAELREAIERLSVPAQVGRGDARRLARETGLIIEVARPARERAIRARREMRDLVEGLLGEMQPASKQIAALDWGLAELGGNLAASHEPDKLASVRQEMLVLVRDLAGTSQALRGRLERATSRVRELEDRLAAREEELSQVTEALSQANEALGQALKAADRDPLTGLANRGCFDRTLLEAIRHRKDGGGQVALLLVDVDHFKRVNDTHGHDVGDEVLRAVAGRLRHAVRGEDLPARVGGEEFAIILKDATLDGAVATAERARRALEGSLIRAGGKDLAITASIGVAAHDSEESALSLYRRADRALYDAKQNGRNRAVLAA